MILQTLIGLVLLLVGGEALVRGSVAIALRLGLSPLVIGLTLVALGTSAPELVSSIQAALLGAPGIAVGNVVGSNLANILLILGLAAVVAPIAVQRSSLRRDGATLVVATASLVVLVLLGTIGRLTGIAFVLVLAAYTWIAYRSERVHPEESNIALAGAEAAAVTRAAFPWRPVLLVVIGLAALVFGGSLLVEGAVSIARDAGVSEAVIGLTLVAIGTSLPELVTSLVAAFRRQTGIAFGNIVGSSIFNIWGILGVTAIVHPLDVPSEIAGFDIWVLTATTIGLVLFSASGWVLSRREGAFLVLAYCAYLVVQLTPSLRGAFG